MRGLGRMIISGVVAACASSSLDAAVSVAGRVIDENGVIVAGARVEAFTATGHAATNSDDAGNFNLELAAPGEYQMRAEQQGFFVYSGKSISFQEGPNQL